MNRSGENERIRSAFAKKCGNDKIWVRFGQAERKTQGYGHGSEKQWENVRIQKQTSKHKVIVFIGDGGYDDCEDDYKIPYPEVDEANAARKEGIRILYLGIGEWLDPSSGDYNKEAHDHALLLAGGEENYIQIADFNVNLHCLFVFI
ncbi:hypothetical protein Y032_0041g405 [Ancylostoma ceylanicum]|uniref:VWFA domain-containing protein n=1 Tax=Ancylostoma ceylanicum TaxID=53326 RepID=A0A016UGC4_9BILA|nr:hypothetical protein Y032_0041g405 [Ancylostoma ceylanicum]